MRSYKAAIYLINDMLHVVSRAKFRYQMWDRPDLKALQLESDLIELRTACHNAECSAAEAVTRMFRLRSRMSALHSEKGVHPTLSQRMAQFALPPIWNGETENSATENGAMELGAAKKHTRETHDEHRQERKSQGGNIEMKNDGFEHGQLGNSFFENSQFAKGNLFLLLLMLVSTVASFFIAMTIS
ncbi:MAG: hypothetical protein MJE77_02550 [Proteobacteria bacterium]|nr:hypothetical protein [Pseudomonadota bacterium]